MKFLKKIIILIIALLSYNSSYGSDTIQQYDLSGLGVINYCNYGMPVYVSTITINSEAVVDLIYNGYDSDSIGEFRVFLSGSTLDVASSATYNNNWKIEKGSATLQPGTYEIYTKNTQTSCVLLQDSYQIGQMYFLINYVGGGGGVGYDTNYKKIGFFATEQEFIDFFVNLCLIYMIFQICIFIFIFFINFYEIY